MAITLCCSISGSTGFGYELNSISVELVKLKKRCDAAQFEGLNIDNWN